MGSESTERGWGFILLMGALAIPFVALLVWAVMFVLNVVFGVPISLDWAFGVVMLGGLGAGPVVVVALAWRRSRREAIALRQAPLRGRNGL